ncbi:MAG TPA: pyrroline-5-carboxylate reductase [Chloroflexi bacterium]|nr:pyrroline-5-carboxylate reductase [Chloroflexota bacterium]
MRCPAAGRRSPGGPEPARPVAGGELPGARRRSTPRVRRGRPVGEGTAQRPAPGAGRALRALQASRRSSHGPRLGLRAERVQRKGDAALYRPAGVNDTTLHGSRVAIVGAGVIAEAMLSGLLGRGLVEASAVVCSHPREERRRELSERHGVTAVAANAEAAAGADIILLAVKPQMLKAVMPELKPQMRSGQLVISVIAGAGTHALAEGLDHPALVRCMPNTPAQIGQGVTVWFATPSVDATGRAQTRTMLSALGREFEVHDERQVAMATAVSGSGPTYIFLFIEALTDAAVHLGFPRHLARELVLDTMQGSAAFALASGRHVAELRDMVTSPGGTSAAAMYELERGRLRTVVSDAVWAAFERTLGIEAALEGRPPDPSARPR